jgi:hypothetical protein
MNLSDSSFVFAFVALLAKDKTSRGDCEDEVCKQFLVWIL